MFGFIAAENDGCSLNFLHFIPYSKIWFKKITYIYNRKITFMAYWTDISGKVYNEITDFPEDTFGFVYRVKNKSNGDLQIA